MLPHAYLLSLPQHIQIKEIIINATNTPPNVIKNIPNEVTLGAVGGSRPRAGLVGESCVVGLTTAVMVTDEGL